MQTRASFATTMDTILAGQLTLEQPVDGPRAGLDAVFLARAMPIAQGQVLDVGAGTGVVGLVIAKRSPDVSVTAIEVDPDLAALIERNARANSMATRVRVVVGDVLAPLRELGLTPASFDYVLCNPPFATHGEGRIASSARRQRAHAMGPGEFDRWARCWAALARADGRLVLVHRADRIGDILAALDGRFGALEIKPLHPRHGAPAHRILVRGVKGSRATPALLPGMVLHHADGTWTAEAGAVLAGGAAVWPQ